MKAIGAGLLVGVSSILITAVIASCLSKKPRDDTSTASRSMAAPVPPPATARGPGDAGPVRGIPPSRPAPRVLTSATIPAAHPAPEARADADGFYAEERWLEAGNAYLEVLASFPEHPEAEEMLERAFESYEWIESERQVEVLEEIFRKFPSRRTPARVLEHAVLKGVHGDPAAAIPSAELALSALPEDAFRVYALRRIAGLHRAAGDRRREEILLVEGRALASALGDERTAAEIDRLLSGSAAPK